MEKFAPWRNPTPPSPHAARTEPACACQPVVPTTMFFFSRRQARDVFHAPMRRSEVDHRIYIAQEIRSQPLAIPVVLRPHHPNMVVAIVGVLRHQRSRLPPTQHKKFINTNQLSADDLSLAVYLCVLCGNSSPPVASKQKPPHPPRKRTKNAAAGSPPAHLPLPPRTSD